MEPITIFSRNIDPAGIVRRIIEMGLEPILELDGTPEDWGQATLTFSEGDEPPRLLYLNHDPNYYAKENFAGQMNGMANYFDRFPESERKSIALGLIGTFRFSIATLFEPDFDPEGDPRLSVVCAVTEAIDGVLFTPSGLRDASGRILYT